MLAICHTYYSFQAGTRSPKDWAGAAAARGYTALAIADVNNLHGAVHFYRAVGDAGLHPVVGTTLHWGPGAACVALATSETGYRQLCRLLTSRHLQRPFHLDHALVDTSDLLFLARTPSVLNRLARRVPPANLYALPPALEPQQQANLWDSLPVDIPIAPIPEAWCIDPADRETTACLRRLRNRNGTNAGDTPETAGDMLLPSVAEWRVRYPKPGLAEEVRERCRFAFHFGVPLLPGIRVPAGETAMSHLRRCCQEALNRHYRGPRQIAASQRLERELDVIGTNRFADYFLYVYEIIRFAQTQNIPVEVRGSAASSIVSYLLGFTHCCPLEHDLFFERFMNPGRRDCPDIDIDIADNRRDEVINYCYRRWGEEHVAMIAAILTYRTRSAVHDAGRILGLRPAAVQRFLDQNVPIARQADLVRVASRLVGLPRHLSVHCGGLIITACPLTDVTPLTRAAKGVIVSHYEKDQAEAIGLVKMDLLGNSALSLISAGIDALNRHGTTLAEPGPEYDYKVNRLFANGDTLGIYQCESPGMRQLCRALKPGTPKDVAAALSLIRPGPAAAGMKDAFIRRRRRLDPITYLHPKMADFLGATYGVMLYQEDVMKVAVHLAGYTIADADVLRRAVSKARAPGGLAREHNNFVFTKAGATGLDVHTAERVWQHVEKFASYSYCKAHASVYGRLAWLTARLKAHHPREFFAAVLNCHKSMYPQRVFVWDALRHGIPVFPPEINTSEVHWVPMAQGVAAGLGIIKGLRRSLVQQLVAERRRRPFADLRDLRCRVAFQHGELERLILVNAGRRWGPREALLGILRDAGHAPRQLSLFAADGIRLAPLMEAELLLMGIPFSAHPVATWSPDECSAAAMARFVNREVTMTGILDTYKHTQTEGIDAKPRDMSFVTLEDASGLFEVVLFPDTHSRLAPIFTVLGPYRVRGVVRQQWDSLTLELRDAEHA